VSVCTDTKSTQVDAWRCNRPPAANSFAGATVMNEGPNNPRAIITGFYGGFLAGGRWQEFAPVASHDWRTAFEPASKYGIPSPHGLPKCEYLEARVIEASIIAELRRIGLWHEEALTSNPERVAICFTSSKGRMAYLETGDITRAAWGCDIFDWTCDWAATSLARITGAQGPMLSPVGACASGSHAVALGAQLIEDGYADVALCGAIESETPELAVVGYRQIGALSKSGVMRPFDKHRDGFVLGEGLGFLVLESVEHAQLRNAHDFGTVSGWSMLADATHLTAMEPSGSSVARAIEAAMKRAGVLRVDYINAHGTATPRNDVVETRGIKSALGTSVPVSSTKSVTGHLFGASGALEAIFCLLAMRDNWTPPTLNLVEPDNECDLDYIANVGREINLKTVASLNYGFGGHIGVLLFEK